MEYTESIIGDIGVARFMGLIGKVSMDEGEALVDFKVYGPMDGEWGLLVETMNQTSIYEFDVPWDGGGEIL
jgi:hypothetical protein